MGKTVFTEGNPSQGIPATKVTDDFLNAIQGHKHDGLDQDGSAPKVNLAAESNITDVTLTTKHHPMLDNGILYLEEEA